MAPRTRRAAHGARAETERQALLLAVQALGVNAERVQEAEKKQAEAERERDVAVQLLTTLLGKLEDVWKQDVLVLAADKGSTAVVSTLLKDDDVDKDGEGSEALEEEVLLGATALVAAAYAGQPRCLELLLSAGADAERADNDGYPPLHAAAQSGCLACVERLLEAGKDKDIRNADGETALHRAARFGHAATVEVLLAAGCSVDPPDMFGLTPLLGAAVSNESGTSTSTVKLLLDAGANKALVCNDRKTALWYAEQGGKDAIAALLRD